MSLVKKSHLTSELAPTLDSTDNVHAVYLKTAIRTPLGTHKHASLSRTHTAGHNSKYTHNSIAVVRPTGE